MEKNISILDLDSFDDFDNLTLEKRFEKIIAVCESDAITFEKIDVNIALEERIFKILEELENKNQWKEIERLDFAIRCKSGRFEEFHKYISSTIIPLYLAEDIENSKEQKSRIEKFLGPFFKSPEERTEIYFDVIDKLIFFGQPSIAVDLCRKTHTQIVNCQDFICNPREHVEEVLIWDIFQDVYKKFKKKKDFGWASYNKLFKSYDYRFTTSDLKCFEEIMQGHLEPSQLSKEFKIKSNGPFVLFQIKLAYCCQMYEMDGTSFVISSNLATKVLNTLARIFGKDKSSLESFFNIKPEMLEPCVSEHLTAGECFDPTCKQFAFLAAFPVLYQFLLKAGILDKKAIDQLLPAAASLLNTYEKKYSDKPWRFNFTKKLKNQAGLLAELNR